MSVRITRLPIEVTQFAVFFPVLAVAALLAPAPGYRTDRELYEAIGRQVIIPDCALVHCFRPLVPWVVERFPGPSLLKWKLSAALLNAIAGIASGRLARTFGLTSYGANLAAALSAFGYGAFFTLFDPHTADPLMFALSPVIFRELWLGRIGAGAALSSIAVLGKEFGAAPLWIFTLFSALGRQWLVMLRSLVAANFAMLCWVALQLTLMLRYQYSYANSAGADVLRGGFIVFWLSHMSARSALSAVFAVFGPVYLLAVAGFFIGGPEWRRLAASALPAALAFCYVQQPDRALWNFHFIVIPMAAVVLERTPGLLAWAFVVCFATLNMRLGAQLSIVPSARLPLFAAVAIAATAVVWTIRTVPAQANAAAS